MNSNGVFKAIQNAEKFSANEGYSCIIFSARTFQEHLKIIYII